MPVTWIDPATLVDRRIYRIRSRNLVIGAWDAKSLGFIGLREKFGTEYLFTEYERDLAGPPHGTARAMDDLGVDVPQDVLMEVHIRPEGGGITLNQPLFDLLLMYESEAFRLLDKENDRLAKEYAAREAALTPEQKAERTRLARERIDAGRKRAKELE